MQVRENKIIQLQVYIVLNDSFRKRKKVLKEKVEEKYSAENH